jgi:hypothetical protein
MMKDLFGNELTEAQALAIVKRKTPQPRGYAAPPGTGPKGETCRTCAHYTLREFAKVYRKCGLMEAKWTGGPATDILARAPACRLWKGREGPPKERGGYYG